MKVNIRLAGCAILDKQDRILLLHRNTDKRQQWEIPGGKIEPGESAGQAAVREVKEELGVDVEIIKMLGSREFIEDGHSALHLVFGRNYSRCPCSHGT